MKKILKFLLNFIFSFNKIDDKTIVFFSSRNKVDGNPKSIYLYMKKYYSEKYRLIYLVNKHVDISSLNKNDVKFYRSFKSYYYISKAKYWILSDSVQTLIDKKKNQIYIQTFHGHGPIKKGEKEIADKFNAIEKVEHIKNWDIYISMCKEDETHMINQTGFDRKIARLGISSTDSIVDSKKMSEQYKNELKKKLGIPLDKKIVLYAPTYREKLLSEYNIKLKCESLKLLKDYIFLIRLHPLLNSKIDQTIFKDSNFIDCCNVPDIVDLYPIVDILISDYSAAIYEFALTNKKIILYPYDFSEFEKFPGYVIDYKKVMPGPICYDEKELYNVLNNMPSFFEDYEEKLLEFNNKFNYLNDGTATKRFVDNLIDKRFEE